MITRPTKQPAPETAVVSHPATPKRSRQGSRHGLALAIGIALLAVSSANAQTAGTWNLNGNGNWNTAGNWTGGIPNGIDDIANITNQITTTRTITLDVPVTLGTMNIGDLSGGSSFTVTGNTLTFEASGGGNATLNMINDGGNVTISSTLQLNSALDIFLNDPTNNQGIILSGIINGGMGVGNTSMTINDLTGDYRLNWVLLNQANTFTGQVLVQSGLLRYEGNNAVAGARGVGNETIVENEGGVDLRDRDFNVQADDTEIFRISGMGPNGVGALRNTSGTGSVSHLILDADSSVGGYSNGGFYRHLDTAGTAEIASIVDLGGFTLNKLGTGEWRFHNADIQGRTGATINVYEGEIKFENNGALLGSALIDGTVYGNNLDGLTINVITNKTPYDGVDPANGSRTFDPFNPPATHTEITGNSVVNSRLSFGTYWSGTTTHPLNTKVVDNFDNFTVNLSNGTWQREGSTGAGQTFDQVFGSGVTINLVSGGMGKDAVGSGNLFDIQGGSASYNTTLGSWDYPGAAEFQGHIDNTSVGNSGTGFTVRGSREMRVTGDNSTSFNGDILIKQSTGRWITNSFTTTGITGIAPPTKEYTNMSLAGSMGNFSGANSITLTRWGSLALLNNSANPDYASANNDNRLNDAGFLNMRNGFLKLETDVTTPNTENFGNVVADFGSNYIYLDNRAGGTFNGSMQTFTRNNNGILKIYSTNPAQTFGASGSDNTLLVNNTAGITTVGSGAPGSNTAPVVIGAFGAVLPTLATPTIGSYTRSIESVQGSFMFSGGGMQLMTLDNGYLRPLTSAEFDTAVTPGADTNWLIQGYISPTGGNVSDRNNYADRQITADTVINSLTIGFDATASGQAIPTATKDYLIIQPGATLTISSGIINYNSFVEANSANMETVIRGGSIDVAGQTAIINSNAMWHDLDRNTANWYEVMTGNNGFMRSHITNAAGLVKTGRNNIYLETSNEITGNIVVSEQGSIIARHPGALGAGGAGREVQVGGGSAFLLEYGTNIEGVDVRATNTLQTSATVLRNEGTTHSTWLGNVILDVADGYGTSEFQDYIITARNNGTLTVGGNIYTDNNANLTDSDSFSDPPRVSTSIGETYTLNLKGQFRDIATGNLGTDPSNVAITSIYRTGDSATRLDANHSLRFYMGGHDEGNVNVFQQWDATGRIDMRQGYFRVQYDPSGFTGANDMGFYTDGARSLLLANDYYTRPVLGYDGGSTTNAYHGHLMLTQADQVFNAPYLYAYNDNRNGTLTIGGENESGTVYFGSRDNSVNFSLQYANQTTERDVRFLQVRGGSMVFNGRLDDENSTVQSFNSVATIIGPGSVTFNRNTIGTNDIDRWNFIGGTTTWEATGMTGNDQFASNSTQSLVGRSGWGGGTLIFNTGAAARSQQLNSNIYLLGGASVANPRASTTLTLGSATAVLDRRSGSSLSFIEDGTMNLTAVGLSAVDGDFLGAWTTYGTTATGITDWTARQGTGGGVQAFAGYTADAFGTGVHTNLTGSATLGGSDLAATLRIAAAADLTIGSGNTLTLEQGGLLIPATNAGPVNILDGSITSEWASGSNDLMLYNYGTGVTTLSSVVADGSGKVNLVLAGNGTTVLTGDNTYTGDTHINGGVLTISSDSALGDVNGSIAKIVRVALGSTNGASLTGQPLTFTTSVAPTSGATGTYNTNSSQQISSLAITDGGSGYTSGVYVSTDKDNSGTVAGDGNGGIHAIMDSGNIHLNGGTLHVTDTMTLNGARTIFLAANGGTFQVDPDKELTIDGYISSEFSHATVANGYLTVNQIGTDWQPASDRNPDIGDMIIEGGGTVRLTGAPDGTVRGYQVNNYGGITWINDGTLRISAAGSSAGGDNGYAGILGTNRSWVDGTIIGANGTLMLNTTSDVTLREWLTFRGQGYQGQGTIVTVGTARSYSFATQMEVEQDMLINNKNASNIYLNNGGGDMFGDGDITRIGNGTLRFYGNAPNWTGEFKNAGRDVYLASAGNLQGMSAMTMTRNSILYFESGSTSIDEFRDRLPDDLPVNTDGYVRMRLRGTGGVFSGEEKVGTANVQGGQLGLEFDIGADITGGANRLQGDYAIWHFTELNRGVGTSIHLRPVDSGVQFATKDFGTTQFNDVVGLQVDVLPAMTGAGDGTNGDAPVVQGVFAGIRPDWFNTAGTGNLYNEDRISNRLTTVDTTPGGAQFIRPLTDAEYTVVSHPNAAVTENVPIETLGLTVDQNLKIVGVTTDTGIGAGELLDRRNSILSLNSMQTINSLTFESESFVFDDRATSSTSSGGGRGNFTAIWMDPCAELTINSGLVSVSNTGVQNVAGDALATNWNLDLRSAINGGFVNMNGQDAHFNVAGIWAFYNTADAANAYRTTDGDNVQLYLNSTIRNANNFIKTGASSMFVQAAQEYTGNTYLNHGILYARHDEALGLGTDVFVTGAGGLVVGHGVNISGKNLTIGAISGNNLGLALQDGASWGGNIIVDNVDIAGGTSYIRAYTPRIYADSTRHQAITGNIYGGSSPIGAPGVTDSRMFATYTGGAGILDIRGNIMDTAAGAVTGPLDISNINQVLRMEVVANNNESTVQLWNPHDAAGRIRLLQANLVFMGSGDFYTANAAAAIESAIGNPAVGFQMGGRSTQSSDGSANDDLSFFLANAGANFNLSSWEVGVESYDPENRSGNDNFNRGNTAGNSTLGGLNTSGTVSFGTGAGAITFTDMTRFAAYTRDLRLSAAAGGTVNINAALVDGGAGVTSTITKIGEGTVNLNGSSFGPGTVEGVNVLGGFLTLQNYGVNADRRVADGATLLLGGGGLLVDGSTAAAPFAEDFSSFTVNAGGSAIVAVGPNATVNVAAAPARAAGGQVHFQSIAGGTVNLAGVAASSRIGSWATYGSSLTAAPTATDWAATDGAGNVVAFTGYTTDVFGATLHTDVASAGTTAAVTESVRFDASAGTITGGALTLNDGGILITSNYGGTEPIGAGVAITTVASGTDLIIHNFAPAGVTIAGDITGAQNVVFNGTGVTVLGGANDYTGATFVTGASTVEFDDVTRFGATSAFTLNGGKLNFTGVTVTSAPITQGITLGGNGGALAVADAGSRLVIRGNAANQITSDANPTAAITTGNTFSGGLTFTGPGTIQFGDRSAGTTTRDLLGVQNNYTGLTIIGDGTTAVTVDIQGQGNDNEQYSVFGTTYGWADGTILRNNSTLEISTKRGDGSRDNQIRFREWFQFGENPGDQVTVLGSTQRQPTFDGQLNFIGDVIFNATGNLYGDAGGTGNSEFLLNPNEGGIFGDGNITKTGNGNLRFYNNLNQWTGDLDIQDGFVGIQSWQTSMFEPTGKIYFGDPLGVDTTTIQMRIEQRFGNSTTGLDTGFQTSEISRDMIVRDGLAQEVRIALGYSPETYLTFSGDFNVGSGSKVGGVGVGINQVRLYLEDTTGVDGSLTGHQQHDVLAFTGNLTGDNNILLDSNEGGSVNDDANDQFTTFLFSGDNSGFTGRLTIGPEAGTGTNNFDRDDNEIFRAGSSTALSDANDVQIRNLATLQTGGNTLTIGNLTTTDGTSTTGIYSFTSPTWAAGRQTTADLDAKAGQAINGTTGVITATDYTPLGDSSAIIENASATPGTLRITQSTDGFWDAYFRDGVPDGAVGENCAATPGSLSLDKLGTGKAVLTIFNDYTGTTTVTAGELQVGTGGDGSWGTYTQGDRTIDTASGFSASGAAGSTGTGDTIAAGGTLSGNGHIRGNAIVDSGTLAPGPSSSTYGPGGGIGTLFIGSNDSVGSAPVGNLTFNGGSTKFQLSVATDYYGSLDDGTYYIEQGAAYQSYINALPGTFAGTAVNPDYFGQSGTEIFDGQHDHLEVGGNVLWNGGNIVVNADEIGYFPAAGDVFNLIDWFGLGTNWGAFNVGSSNYLIGNGDDNGNLDLPDLSSVDPALRWDASLFTSHGILVVAYSPEPSRFVLLIGGLSLVFLRRRRTAKVG